MKFDLRIALPTALVLAAAAFPAASSGQGPMCPQNNMQLIPANSVPSGDKKDKNGDHLICGKMSADGGPLFTGGPDDDNLVDDILP